MNVYLNSVDGIADAFVSLLMSKRSWTPEKEGCIRDLCSRVLTRKGEIRGDASDADLEAYEKHMRALLKWGTHHITLLKYIDLSFTVEGLHRAGQDDWDAHAQRFQNRIIRSSTRLADFHAGEMSDWYHGKIIPTDLALEQLHIALPEQIEQDGQTYVRAVNGYIREDLKDNKDVKRGLYMLSIPSNFIFRCNLADFAHVYQQRGQHGSANPEVKEMAEMMADLIGNAHPMITRGVLLDVNN